MSSQTPIVAVRDKIITALKRPVKRDNELRSTKGIDISQHSISLQNLLIDLADVYTCAMDDFYDRSLPTKPKKILEDNFPEATSENSKFVFDYGKDKGIGLDDWPSFWHENFFRPRGNPGISRLNGLPLQPLHILYKEIEHWWLKRAEVTAFFNPTFGRNYLVSNAPYHLDYCNCPARLLCIIAQWLNPSYLIENVAGLIETRKKQRL